MIIHRVRVCWYRDEKGEQRPFEPVGIVYSSDWCCERAKVKQLGQWMDVGGLRPGVVVAREVTGRVVACRVQLVGEGIAYAWGSFQTELTLDANA